MGCTGGVAAVVVAMGAGIAPSAFAQQSVLSAAGFTGLSVTPTARLLPWGAVQFAYDNEIVGGPTTGKDFTRYGTDGHNFVVGFGLSRFVEVSGRLATNKIQENCYSADGCGLRDLSANAKIGFPLDLDGRWNVAAGATDFGGNVTVFRTMYGVLTYSPENFDFSLGYARRGTGLTGGTRPLDGPFASIAYRPVNWLQAHIEYNDSKAWTGVRLFAPSDWMPSGWSAYLSANLRAYGEEKTSKSWVGFGVSIPLYKVPVVREEKKNYLNPSANADPEKSAPARNEMPQAQVREFPSAGLESSPPLVASYKNIIPSLSGSNEGLPVPASLSDDELLKLADALKVKGFEDISVGRLQSGAIAVRVNNATYNVNVLDGLGVALGVIARRLGESKAGYTLVLMQRQIPIVAVRGNADCLTDWLAMRPSRCVAGQLYTPGTTTLSELINGVVWTVDSIAPSWKSVRLSLQPILRSGVATEYGVFDYSLGIRATLQQPLWQGAYAEVSRVTPLDNSQDFNAGKIFGNDRLISSTDRVLLHQVFRIPIEKLFGENYRNTAASWGAASLTGHVAVGRINSNYRGTYGEIRWEPFEGRHRFGFEGGEFERMTSYDYNLPKKSKTALGSYRYSYLPTRTDFEVTAGQFLYNDVGAQFLISQWFDDVSLNLYYRQTKFDFEKTPRKFIGIELVVPLTPRKDMTPVYHMQVTGVPRWSYAIETKVGGANYVSTNQGTYPGIAVLDRTFNSDRSGVAYFEENMARIRSAAAQ